MKRIRIFLFFLTCSPAVNLANASCAIDEPLSHKPPGYQEYIYDLYINDNKYPKALYFLLDENKILYVSTCTYSTIFPGLDKSDSLFLDKREFYKATIPTKIDHSNQSIYFSVPANTLAQSTVNLSPNQRNDNITKPTLGAYLNYDISVQNIASMNKTIAGMQGEWVVYGPSGYVNNSFLASNIRQNMLIRLESTWTRDSPEQMTTWRVGDVLSGRDIWSNSVRMGGIQYYKNYGTQPYFVTYPLPAYTGEAVIPTQLEFYVNDQFRLNQSVQPGPFSIEGLPAISGSNEIAVQTIDLLGRSQVAVIPFYLSTQMLAPGLDDFSYELGLIRKNYGINSNNYGRFLFNGTHHYGLTNYWTMGGHVELLEKQQTLGLSNIHKLWSIGILHTAYSVSLTEEKTGNQVLVRFDRNVHSSSFGAQFTAYSSQYRQIGFSNLYPPPNFSVFAYSGFHHPRLGSINFNYTYFKRRILHHDTIITATYQRQLFKDYHVVGSYTQLHASNRKHQFYFSIYWSPKKSYTASLSSSINRDQNGYNRTSARASLVKSPALNEGYGYRAYIEHDKDPNVQADVIFRDQHAEYIAKYSRYFNTNNLELGMNGAIITHDKGFLFSHRIQDSFAIIDTQGVADIKIYEGNNIVGKTNHKGQLVMPRLRAYEKNNLDFRLNELPIELFALTNRFDFIPYAHSGYVVNFNISKPVNLLFYLHDRNNQPLKPGGWVELEANETKHLIGYNGMVFIQMPISSNKQLRGQAFSDDGPCNFIIELSNDESTLTELGVISCH